PPVSYVGQRRPHSEQRRASFFVSRTHTCSDCTGPATHRRSSTTAHSTPSACRSILALRIPRPSRSWIQQPNLEAGGGCVPPQRLRRPTIRSGEPSFWFPPTRGRGAGPPPTSRFPRR